MPHISVIIPVYNGEKTIKETIESVLNQSFSDFELIVINDGSHDTTLEIVSSIQDYRLKVFSYPNAGASASRNRGFSHAVGEFVAFLDADDLWTADKLQAQFNALQDNPEAAVAYSWTDYIDESGKFLRPGGHISVSGNIYKNLLLVDLLENGSNPLIRREAITAVGGFDESLPAGQDWDLYLRLAARYHFVCVPASQILYRISTNSISSNVFRMESACLQLIERTFNQAPESLQYLKTYSLANIYKYLTYKALEEPSERRKSLAAIRFLWLAIINDRVFIQHKLLILQLFIKILTVTLLPSRQAHFLLNKFAYYEKFSQIATINRTVLEHIQVEAT